MKASPSRALASQESHLRMDYKLFIFTPERAQFSLPAINLHISRFIWRDRFSLSAYHLNLTYLGGHGRWPERNSEKPSSHRIVQMNPTWNIPYHLMTDLSKHIVSTVSHIKLTVIKNPVWQCRYGLRPWSYENNTNVAGRIVAWVTEGLDFQSLLVITDMSLVSCSEGNFSWTPFFPQELFLKTRV